MLAGPYASMLLGDLGARVIKVERPGAGDDTRNWGPPFVGPAGDRQSTYYLSANRNKQSLVLDLKDPADLAVLRQLLRTADVLVENFRPGVMARLGLAEDELRRLNPALVTASITGFGETGPARDRVGYDQVLQAEGGLMGLTGDRADNPTRVGVPIADLTAGMFAVMGILAALVERSRSGHGQHVHTSLLAGQIAIHSFQGTRYLVGGEVPGPSGNHHPTVAPYGLYATSDQPVVIAVGNDAIWRRFAAVVGVDPDDERFSTNEARLANREELDEALSASLRAAGARHWMSTLESSGVPVGEVRTLDRVYEDPQVLEQGLVIRVNHPTLGAIRLPGNPLQFSRSVLAEALPPPLLGEHNAQIRDELRPVAPEHEPVESAWE